MIGRGFYKRREGKKEKKNREMYGQVEKLMECIEKQWAISVVSL